MDHGRAYLVRVDADGLEGERWEVTGKPLVVGRGGDDVHVVVADKKVSRQHCALVRRKNGQYTLEDVYSTNGTWVNGERVTKVTLKPYDRISVGNARFVFKSEKPTDGRKQFKHFASPAKPLFKPRTEAADAGEDSGGLRIGRLLRRIAKRRP